MAIQHIRAVQEHRKEYDELEFAIMTVVATDMGNNDEPAYTSYRKIAERAGCHRNTVGPKTDEMAEAGKLIKWREGKYTYYKLPYDCGEYEPGHRTAETAEDPAPDSGTLSQRLAQYEERLSHLEKTLSQRLEELSQRLAQIDTLVQSIGGTKEGKKKKVRTPTPTPSPNGDDAENSKTGVLIAYFCGKTGVARPYTHEINKWRAWANDANTLLGLCNDDLDQAKVLIDRVLAYMDESSLTYAKPGSLVTIARRMVTTPESAPQDEKQKEAERIFDDLIKKSQRLGRYRVGDWGLDDRVKAALRQLGGDHINKICGNNPYQYMGQFVEAYGRV